MSGKLAVGVAVRHPDTGAAVFLRAGSTPPDWARDRLGAHLFADDPAPPARPATPVAEPEPVAAGGPPPRYGRGSSAAAWREWAGQAGVDLSGYGPDPTREQVITAAVRAGILDDE